MLKAHAGPLDDQPWRAIKEPEWRAVLAATQALTRTDNEDELLHDVCEAAVRTGGYLLAWYGRVVHNGVFRLHSIAASGTATAYLDDFRVSWDKQFAPGSPGGMAVDSTEPVFTTDVLTDPDFAAWRDRATQFGIRSLVSIPVMANSQIDGVLTIYSDEPDVFDATSVAVLKNLAEHVGAGIDRLQHIAQVNDALEGTIRVLTRAVEARDSYTAGHQAAVSALAEQIAVRLGLPEPQVQGVRLAGLVHDLGKVAVPIDLLTKPGELRATELALLHDHAAIGEEILSTVVFPWPIAEIVGQHHERIDGSGYPKGLRGDEIRIEARIIAVADVAEAMGRSRPFRPAHTRAETLEFLAAERGGQLDAAAVDACLEILADGSFVL
jgi:putative nucleotidyltransferase with HDIG domain